MTPEQLEALEAYGAVLMSLDQIKGLVQAMHLALEAEQNGGVPGNVPVALATALDRATDDAIAMLEGNLHPCPRP